MVTVLLVLVLVFVISALDEITPTITEDNSKDPTITIVTIENFDNFKFIAPLIFFKN